MELPYLAHTDEPTQYNPAINIITKGDFNPHFFNYPSLTIYIDALVMYVGFGVGKVLGVFESLADLQPIRTLHMSVGLVGTPQMLLLGRATSAVMGTLTVALVFMLARELAQKAWVPVFSALLLTISRAHVQFSHYMTVDVMATFFAIACVLMCTLALTRHERRYVWWAAVCGGLATSSKYNYAVLSVPVGLTCLLYPSYWLEKVRRVLLSGGLFVLAFVVTSPYVLLDFGTASRAIVHEMRHYATGHLGVSGSSFLWYVDYLRELNGFYLLFGVPGLIVFLWRDVRAVRAACAGVGPTFNRAFRFRRWSWWVSHVLNCGAWRGVPLVSFTLIYMALISKQAVHFDRNILPVLVMLVVGTGCGAEALLAVSLKAQRYMASARSAFKTS